jgi:hypothetical protein
MEKCRLFLITILASGILFCTGISNQQENEKDYYFYSDLIGIEDLTVEKLVTVNCYRALVVIGDTVDPEYIDTVEVPVDTLNDIMNHYILSALGGNHNRVVLKIDTLDELAYRRQYLTTSAEISWPAPKLDSGWHVDLSFSENGASMKPLSWSEYSVKMKPVEFHYYDTIMDSPDLLDLVERIRHGSWGYLYYLEFKKIDAVLP